MVFAYYSMVELNSYNITSKSLPSGAKIKIAQISDFHNCKLTAAVIERVKESSPDIIVITGDLIDSRSTKIERATELTCELVKIAPCYYVSGNHEARINEEYLKLKEQLENQGVTVLENQALELEINGVKINLIGLSDPKFALPKGSNKALKSEIDLRLGELVSKDLYNVALCHRPEAFNEYLKNGIDLVFTGHAHGGQIILPLFGGIIAPNQGLFPRYYKGLYSKESTVMAVSRGIGNNLFPFRMFNNPEVLEITVKGE